MGGRVEVLNETPFAAGWTMGFERDGRELLIVVVKGTFTMPRGVGTPEIAQEQVPLVESDRFTGEPGLSSVVHEVDFAHRKPRCDVLLNGCAHAPEGRPVERVRVGLQVGGMKKSFDVVGDREWEWAPAFVGLRHSAPRPFATMPITYDRAFGGAEVDPRKTGTVHTCLTNPVGVGYYPHAKDTDVVGKPLPNTEQIGVPATSRSGKYEPMSFGPIGRNFAERLRFAGTYDQQWLDRRAPFWPDDFDYAYFQAAPADQQVAHLRGGEEIVLENLTPEGLTRFVVPVLEMPIAFVPADGSPETEMDGLIDTLLLDPEARRFSLVWRASMPMRRDCFDILSAIVGRRARKPVVTHSGGPKRKFKSISEFIAWKRGLIR